MRCFTVSTYSRSGWCEVELAAIIGFENARLIASFSRTDPAVSPRRSWSNVRRITPRDKSQPLFYPMNEPKVDLESDAGREAYFAQLFEGIDPAEKHQPTVAQLLEKFRPQLEKKRKDGYSLRQICDRLQAAPLGITIAPSTLLRFLSGKKRRRKKAPAIRYPVGMGPEDFRSDGSANPPLQRR